MIKIISVDIKEFRKIIYPEYKKMFLRLERKSYSILRKNFNDDILKIYKIEDNNIFIGFMMTNSLRESKYIQLDYFAVLPEFQNKGYGTKALELLKEQSKGYSGIFMEIEKVGLGKDNHENFIREKRKNFMKELDFVNLILIWSYIK